MFPQMAGVAFVIAIGRNADNTRRSWHGTNPFMLVSSVVAVARYGGALF
jgi:hypothetical protein